MYIFLSVIFVYSLDLTSVVDLHEKGTIKKISTEVFKNNGNF